MAIQQSSRLSTRASKSLRNALVSLIVPIAILGLWYFFSRDSTSIFFPPLSVIVETLFDTWFGERVMTDIIPSLRRMIVGFVIAVVVGVVAGAFLGRIKALANALNPLLQFARSLPATALIPVAVVLFGIDDVPKIILIAFVSCFPILLNTIDGVRSVDPVLEDVCASFRLTRFQRFFWVQLNAALPQVVSGMRLSLSLAFVVMVSAEMLGATNGIGYVTLLAQAAFQVPLMWSGLILLVILGVLINGIFVIIERALLKWYTQTQEA